MRKPSNVQIGIRNRTFAALTKSVLTHARRGARSVTRYPQVIEDAVDSTLERWEDALLKHKVIADAEGWAYRVASNAAKRIGASRKRRSPSANDVPTQDERPYYFGSEWTKEDLLDAVLRMRQFFRGRQFEVISLLCRDCPSFHAAAKSLRMDRSNFRRTFKSALAVVKRLKTSDPPCTREDAGRSVRAS
jgi:DNA-directed RNA polymerase specialized sigma24 family protein